MLYSLDLAIIVGFVQSCIITYATWYSMTMITLPQLISEKKDIIKFKMAKYMYSTDHQLRKMEVENSCVFAVSGFGLHVQT